MSNNASGTEEGKTAEGSSNGVTVDRIVQQLGVLSAEQLAHLSRAIQGSSENPGTHQPPPSSSQGESRRQESPSGARSDVNGGVLSSSVSANLGRK